MDESRRRMPRLNLLAEEESHFRGILLVEEGQDRSVEGFEHFRGELSQRSQLWKMGSRFRRSVPGRHNRDLGPQSVMIWCIVGEDVQSSTVWIALGDTSTE